MQTGRQSLGPPKGTSILHMGSFSSPVVPVLSQAKMSSARSLLCAPGLLHTQVYRAAVSGGFRQTANSSKPWGSSSEDRVCSGFCVFILKDFPSRGLYWWEVLVFPPGKHFLGNSWLLMQALGRLQAVQGLMCVFAGLQGEVPRAGAADPSPSLCR